MKIFKVSFTVEGEIYGFYYHFDNIPSKHDLNVCINNAIHEHLTDLGINGTYSDLEVSLCP